MERFSAGRRGFLGGLIAAGLLPAPSWADAGAPSFLAAAAQADGSYVLCGIGSELDIRFRIALPARGHAAAAHPHKPEAVAFARRPGTFAIVLDCVTGDRTARLDTPQGRHFYGHGVFSSGGDYLFTTENDYDQGRGRIGVWDVSDGYRRIDEFDSGGVGPHDIRRLPDTETLVIANGGIETHPESGRAKLNIPVMRPNLTYLDHGSISDTAALPDIWHKNSIRHLAVSKSGLVAFGMQWQGDGLPHALLGVHRIGGAILNCRAPKDAMRAMQGYVGSIAFDGDESTIAVTSPRGGIVQLYDAQTLGLTMTLPVPDASGVAPSGGGIVVSSGTGVLQRLNGQSAQQDGLIWDNHLVAL